MGITQQIAEAIKGHVADMHTGQSRTKIKPKEYTAEFELFWGLWKGRWSADKDCYVKPGKYLAFLEWRKLTLQDQYKAKMKAKRASGKYTPDANRWLRDRKFDD